MPGGPGRVSLVGTVPSSGSGDEIGSAGEEDVTEHDEVVFRPPSDDECDRDGDPTLAFEPKRRGLFAAFGTRNSSTEGQREAKNARFGNRQNRLYGGPPEAGGFGRSAAGDNNTQNLTSTSTHENIEQAAAATKLQSRWRGKRARDDVKEVKQFQNAARIGDCNANGKNTRKTPSRVSSRRKVDGGVHGGSLNVVIRHVHFLRGVYLHVRVVSATDVLSMDSNGLSDPYVKVTLVDNDGVPYKKQVKRTNFEFATLDPTWNFAFFIGDAELNLRTTKILFEVFDYDQWSADDPMGSAEFPLMVFDPEEQAMIKRASIWRSKKKHEARRLANANVSPSVSPAFLPGFLFGSSANKDKEEEREFMARKDNTDDDTGEDSDVGSDFGNDPAAKLDSAQTKIPTKAAAADETDSPSSRTYLRRFRRKAEKITAIPSVAGFGDAFNKDRKAKARMLMRSGVFGLDKPLVSQNGERVGEMCWYNRTKAYGTLPVVYDDANSRFKQEAGAFLKQAGRFVSMATIGKTVKAIGVGDFISGKVEAAVDVGKRRAVNTVEMVLGETKQKLCDDLTKDRDMPSGVRMVFQSVVGVYFSEVQQEVLDELARRLKTLSYTKKTHQRRKRDKQSILLQIGINTWYEYFTVKHLRKLVLDFRAWYLYNELPYDKSFWGKLRSPGWWLILTTKLYSGWGIQAFLYAMRLLMLDRTDEWQLFEYIANFKGIQFLSGVIAMFRGTLMYMECAGLQSADSPHTCDVAGPGMDQKSLCSNDGINNITCASIVGVGFFIRILLTWFAFALMRRSFSFGKPIFNDQRLVGAVIEIHELKTGTAKTWRWFGYGWGLVVGCGKGAVSVGNRAYRSAIGKETTPIERFRAAVTAVIDDIKKNDPRWILRNQGHHTKYLKAKVVAYSLKTGLHTIYYTKHGDERDQEEVDLKKKLFSVLTLKQMQPRRLQMLIFYYDLLVFAFVMAVCARVMTRLDMVNDDWQLFGLLYWIQCFYSVLAFPFVCIVIPGVQSLICHAKQTGYDEYGVLQARLTREDFAGVNEDFKEEAPRSKFVPACYPLFQGRHLKRKI